MVFGFVSCALAMSVSVKFVAFIVGENYDKEKKDSHGEFCTPVEWCFGEAALYCLILTGVSAIIGIIFSIYENYFSEAVKTRAKSSKDLNLAID